MLGWETSRSAMGLRAVFTIQKGVVNEVVIDTYRHVNNYLRSAWVFGVNLPEGHVLTPAYCPLWHVTSGDDQSRSTQDFKAFFQQEEATRETLPSCAIHPKAQHTWTLQTTFELSQDALHRQSGLAFEATHLCIMLLPHEGLHAIRAMGVAAK